MPSFRYKAMTGTGAVVRGVGQAVSEAALVQQLRRQGIFPVSATAIDRQQLIARIVSSLRLRRAPSLRTLASVTQELAALLAAGLELDRALGMIAALSDTGVFREPFTRVRQRVRDGAGLADALAAEAVFPAFYVNMVRAGEFGGALDATLAKLASYL